ncbi:amidohydrolase [Anaeropeptidivorans aminofermentans]|uniref:amidohydrolase n=1 Tax=Anaeropeptidivorans aminofermentans TaxID=2934315 RepID=UPI00202428D2|nr:amidohydrolase [Anaeropeptidivorans aminofermentans]MBE6011027.1 amidohydrolase [Lachnospiraceae bacterium]
MLLIKNGRVHTMCKEGTEKCDILINEGKFIKIAKNISISGEELETIDASGLNIYPGFVEAHSHIGISEEKIGIAGNDCNESTNPITPKLRAIDAINPMDSAFHSALSVGITTVMTGPGSSNPIGGQFACIKTDGRRIDDMIVKAPAAMKIAFGENPKTAYGDNGNTPITRMGIASLIREELQKAMDYYHEKNSDNGDFKIDYNYEPYLPLFSQDMPLKAHVHRLDDIFTAIRIAKEFNLLLTLDHCTEGHLDAEEIAQSGFPAIVGPSLSSRSKLEIENGDFKTPGVLKKAGVRVAITTDHPVTRIQYLPICAGLAAKEGLGRENALRAITIDAAIILGISDRVGSIEVGKDADLVIYKGDPLEIMGSAVCTVINGKIAFNKLNHNED